MASVPDPRFAAACARGTKSVTALARFWSERPAAIFLLLSCLFGPVIIAVTPPLRGPDETAHFLRAFGIAQGDIIPSTVDAQDRKGIFLPIGLHEEFAFFEAVRVNRQQFSYREVLGEYWRRPAAPPSDLDPASVFVPYGGSEAYTPIAYLPHVAAALIARFAGLDFIGTLYLMRLAGFAAMTAVVAYALAITAGLRWTFLCIAMLPAALYGRAVISADGGAFAYSLVVVALFLRGAGGLGASRPAQHALWMALCVLSKPPHLAFIVLEAMRRPLKELSRHWRALALIVLPALAGAVWWHVMTSSDAAGWRMSELTGMPLEQFNAAWKLRFMLAHPLHFPSLLGATFQNPGELWRQLIGVLGLFDTVLQPWVYPVLSIIFLAACFVPLKVSCGNRQRVAVAAGLAAVTYCLAVFVIAYLSWTPIHAGQIWGVQGRYFIPALLLLAVVLASLVNRGADQRAIAIMATLGGILSGGAVIEAILRVDWPV